MILGRKKQVALQAMFLATHREGLLDWSGSQRRDVLAEERCEIIFGEEPLRGILYLFEA